MIKVDEFTVNGKKYKQVIPCGMLYSQGRQYFLLHPYPLEPDWELWEQRFVVVPRSQVGQLDDAEVYPFARHIVTNSFVVEYAGNMPPIILEVADIDLADIDMKDLHPIRDIGDYLREEAEKLAEDGFPF